MLCSYLGADDWCDKPEKPTKIESSTKPGQTIQPAYAEKSLIIDKTDTMSFTYFSPVERKVKKFRFFFTNTIISTPFCNTLYFFSK